MSNKSDIKGVFLYLLPGLERGGFYDFDRRSVNNAAAATVCSAGHYPCELQVDSGVSEGFSGCKCLGDKCFRSG